MTRRPRAVRRLAAAAVVAVAAAVALSGCVRMGLELQLEPDDVARPSMILGIEDQVLERTGRSAADFIDSIVGSNDPAESAVRVEDWAADGYTGERYVYGEMNTRRVSEAAGLPVNVVRDGDEYVVTGTLDLTAEGLGLGRRASLDDVDVVVDISFPGPVTESNGTITGNAVRWDPPLGEQYEIHARGSAVDPAAPSPTPEAAEGAGSDAASPGDATTSGIPDWLVALIGVGGLVILLLVGIVVWQALRVRGTDDAGHAGALHPHQPYPHGYPQHGHGPQGPNAAPSHRPPSIPPRG
ncbi:LppM family (lipo)protein [Myceligenerans indicum]|uniref:LppM domain-containing protein n=1 Tax=Myceligenerans indicum TaxID=2593663 RepID=A0ABS1LLY5_9MICO|nr:hypothetical protein [Myceligenerans indicum]MBL0887290.1 hypothetical protein [Myceligenerans indicum]